MSEAGLNVPGNGTVLTVCGQSVMILPECSCFLKSEWWPNISVYLILRQKGTCGRWSLLQGIRIFPVACCPFLRRSIN